MHGSKRLAPRVEPGAVLLNLGFQLHRDRVTLVENAAIELQTQPVERRAALYGYEDFGVAAAEIRAAAKVGIMVNRGAASNTRKFVAELLGVEVSALAD